MVAIPKRLFRIGHERRPRSPKLSGHVSLRLRRQVDAPLHEREFHWAQPFSRSDESARFRCGVAFDQGSWPRLARWPRSVFSHRSQQSLQQHPPFSRHGRLSSQERDARWVLRLTRRTPTKPELRLLLRFRDPCAVARRCIASSGRPYAHGMIRSPALRMLKDSSALPTRQKAPHAVGFASGRPKKHD